MKQTEAQKKAMKKWRAKNKKHLAHYAKEWREKNREKYNAYMREYFRKKIQNKTAQTAVSL